MTEATALDLRLYGIVSDNGVVKYWNMFAYLTLMFQNWQLLYVINIEKNKRESN